MEAAKFMTIPTGSRPVPALFLLKLGDWFRRAWKVLDKIVSWDPWVNYSWSQEGEDRILKRIFGDKRDGFYIDIGAHHPKRFSNTYLFYRKGWRGINVDALPGTAKRFNKSRRRDINLELGVGAVEGDLRYFSFRDAALNTFSPDVADVRIRSGLNSYLGVKNIEIMPLAKILERHLPIGQFIDFMSIDVEGLDHEVLASNDWARFRPGFVLVEMLDAEVFSLEMSVAGQMLASVGYVPFARCVNTVFFYDARDKSVS